MGGTPEFLMDTRRGLYSYQALQSRLAENTFATNGLVDYNSPVIRLANLRGELVSFAGKSSETCSRMATRRDT